MTPIRLLYFKRIFSILACLVVAFVVFGQGCSPQMSKDLASEEAPALPIDGAIDGGGGGGGDPLAPVESVKASSLTGDQMLLSMLSLANLPAVSSIDPAQESSAALKKISTEFLARKSAFPVNYGLSNFTAAMLLGATSLAGPVCGALIDQEKSGSRQLFIGVDFTRGTSSLTNATYQSVVRALATQFWGRDETDDELQMFLDARSEFEAGLSAGANATSASTRSLMVFICSAALSSLDAITN